MCPGALLYELDLPFAGHKGRSRLGEIHGMLTTGVVDFLAGTSKTTKRSSGTRRRSNRGSRSTSGRPFRVASEEVPRDIARSGVLASRLVRLGEAVTS